MRGKPASRDKQGSGRRITPAGAGKTRCLHQPAAVSTDHPRRCGENSTRLCGKKRQHGSPPQVRGKPEGFTKYFTASRITPAGAGKTLTVARSCLASADHPRRCGENSEHVSRLRRDEWITPAGAGKTVSPSVISAINRDHPRRCGENVAVWL